MLPFRRQPMDDTYCGPAYISRYLACTHTHTHTHTHSVSIYIVMILAIIIVIFNKFAAQEIKFATQIHETNKLFSIWNAINRVHSRPPALTPTLSICALPAYLWCMLSVPVALTAFAFASVSVSVYVCARATPHNSFAYFIGCHLIICILLNFWPRPVPVAPPSIPLPHPAGHNPPGSCELSWQMQSPAFWPPQLMLHLFSININKAMHGPARGAKRQRG